MTRVLRVLLLVLVTLGGTAAPVPARDESAGLRLTRVEWHLTRLDGSAMPADTAVELAFSIGGRVTGSGGCNELAGSWSYLGDDRITIGDLSAGRTSCAAAAGRLERRFIQHLILATTFTLEGQALTLRTTEGRALVFQAQRRTGSELVGEWVLVAVDGAPAADLPRSSVSFGEDGSATGMAGCNGFRGRYVVEDPTIRVERVLAGLGTCADHVMAQEVAFLDGLMAGGVWAVSDDTLTIGKRGRGAVILRAVRPVRHALTGTEWRIASISEGGTATADTTIRFDEHGTVSGWSGCNTYRGPWSLDDAGIVMHIGPIMSTRTRCAWDGPDLEAAYLATLEDVIGYKTPDGAALWLTTASGVRITYAPPITPTLTDPNWRLAMIGDVPFDGMAPVNLTFVEDGSFVGNGGCDLIWGSYEVRGVAFRIVDLETGDRVCEPAVNDLQASFLALLPLLDRMTFDGPDLVLSAGEQQLRFGR